MWSRLCAARLQEEDSEEDLEVEEKEELAYAAANPIMTVQRLQMTNENAELESTVSKPVCNEHRCFNAVARRRQHCILQPSLDRRGSRPLHLRQPAKQRVQQPPLSFRSVCMSHAPAATTLASISPHSPLAARTNMPRFHANRWRCRYPCIARYGYGTS